MVAPRTRLSTLARPSRRAARSRCRSLPATRRSGYGRAPAATEQLPPRPLRDHESLHERRRRRQLRAAAADLRRVHAQRVGRLAVSQRLSHRLRRRDDAAGGVRVAPHARRGGADAADAGAGDAPGAQPARSAQTPNWVACVHASYAWERRTLRARTAARRRRRWRSGCCRRWRRWSSGCGPRRAGRRRRRRRHAALLQRHRRWRRSWPSCAQRS